MNNEGNIELVEETLPLEEKKEDSLGDVISKNAKNDTSEPIVNVPKKKSFLDKLLKPQIKLPGTKFKLNPETDNVRSEKKLMYEYIVKDQDGEIIKDYFDAYSVAEVNAYLVSEGYEIYSIKTNKYIQTMYVCQKSQCFLKPYYKDFCL